MLLKFILSELSFTVRSFNSLTQIYKYVLQQLNPADDIQIFNEFFDFKSMKKSSLSEVEDDVSGIESGNEESLQDDSQSDIENRRAKNSDSEDLSDDEDEEEEEEEDSKNSVQATLKRFHSTPELTTNASSRSNSITDDSLSSQTNSSKVKSLNNNKIVSKSTVNKANLVNILSNSKNAKNKKKLEEKKKNVEEDDDDDDDDDDESGDEIDEISEDGKDNRIKTFKNRFK